MVTTAYDYITLANLEDFTGLDYSSVNSTQFSDDRVNATIATAERIINAYLGMNEAVTNTDGVKTCALLISAKLMYRKMVDFGYAIEGQEGNDLMQMSIRSILRMFLGTDVGVDIVPMDGADLIVNV